MVQEAIPSPSEAITHRSICSSPTVQEALRGHERGRDTGAMHRGIVGKACSCLWCRAKRKKEKCRKCFGNPPREKAATTFCNHGLRLALQTHGLKTSQIKYFWFSLTLRTYLLKLDDSSVRRIAATCASCVRTTAGSPSSSSSSARGLARRPLGAPLDEPPRNRSLAAAAALSSAARAVGSLPVARRPLSTGVRCRH